MGGTGGPGSSRTEAQQGLQGAGLLSGEGPLAPSATSRALGVEGAAQPITTQLAGTASGPVATPLPTSASDTPVAPTTTPAAAAPSPQSSFALATAPAIPNKPFALPTVSNLGLPSADMPLGEVSHVPFGTPAPTVAAPTVAAAPPPTVAAAAPAPAAAANAQSPSDWLYPGNLPMGSNTFAADAFGKPLPYSATGANYTAGYGAAGSFGGQAGHGPPQQGLQDQVLLPQMAAGTQLTGSQIDQYNRVSRADYDRYMKLYGVGYDLPAYQNALNALVAPANALLNTGGSGG